MPVKIRLAQRGKKKNRTYRVVVADSRSPRDGRFIEDLGSSTIWETMYSTTFFTIDPEAIIIPLPFLKNHHL